MRMTFDVFSMIRFLFCDLDKDETHENLHTETVMTYTKNNKVLSYSSNDLVEHQGTAHVILMWWDLQMDKDGEIILSMAPKWMDEGKAKRNEVI